MIDDMTKAQVYALKVLQGMGSREAAREADYKHGTPTMDALELLETCRSIIRDGLAREPVEEQLEHHQEMASVMRTYLRGFDVVDVFRALI